MLVDDDTGLGVGVAAGAGAGAGLGVIVSIRRRGTIGHDYVEPDLDLEPGEGWNLTIAR